MQLSEVLEGAKTWNYGVNVLIWSDVLDKHIWAFNAQRLDKRHLESYIAISLQIPNCSEIRTHTRNEIDSITDLDTFFTSILLEDTFY